MWSIIPGDLGEVGGSVGLSEGRSGMIGVAVDCTETRTQSGQILPTRAVVNRGLVTFGRI